MFTKNNSALASPTLKRTGISFDRVTIEWLPQKYALKYDAMVCVCLDCYWLSEKRIVSLWCNFYYFYLKFQ